MRNILDHLPERAAQLFCFAHRVSLLTMFALIFGFFFWNSVGYFNMLGLESQMRGQSASHECE